MFQLILRQTMTVGVPVLPLVQIIALAVYSQSYSSRELEWERRRVAELALDDIMEYPIDFAPSSIVSTNEDTCASSARL